MALRQLTDRAWSHNTYETRSLKRRSYSCSLTIELRSTLTTLSRQLTTPGASNGSNHLDHRDLLPRSGHKPAGSSGNDSPPLDQHGPYQDPAELNQPRSTMGQRIQHGALAQHGSGPHRPLVRSVAFKHCPHPGHHLPLLHDVWSGLVGQAWIHLVQVVPPRPTDPGMESWQTPLLFPREVRLQQIRLEEEREEEGR